MATEIELKLSLSPAAARTLPQHPLLAAVTPVTHSLFNTYFDTPDLDFRRQQVALRYRKRGREWLLTVKSAEPASGGLARRSEWETRGVPGQWDFGHVDDDSLRNRLERAIPQLAPIFTTHFRRTAWTFEYHGSCIEVALDRGQVASEGRQERICEVELELVRGNVADLFALASELQVTCPLFPAVASKAERGYRLFAGLPSEPFKARAPGFSPDIPPVAAFQTVALSCLEQFQRNVPGISAGTDPEYLHQARVALRRLRSALKVFAPVLPDDFSRNWGDAWKILAASLGEARNWDVFVAETLPPLLEAFPEDHTSRRLMAAARRKAARSRNAVRRLLAAPESPRLLLDFTAALVTLDPSGSATSSSEFARGCLIRRARQASRLARRPAALGDSERHLLRIRCKKLRYTLEFFSCQLPARRLKPYLATLNQLQDELGLINDHVTAIDLVAQLPGKLPQGPVLGWLHGRHALLIEELPEMLETWLAQPAPWKRK